MSPRRRKLGLIFLGSTIVLAVVFLATYAFVLVPSSASDEGVESVGVFGLLPGGVPFTGSGAPAPGDLGSRFLGAAAERLGMRDLPPAALPAAARAYRNEFGHGMDEDLPEFQEDVEAWLRSWRAAYDTGAPWATGMATQR